ncbi:MAG: hypothetical protein ACQEQV_06925 [Fibrobacterota bacterium]
MDLTDFRSLIEKYADTLAGLAERKMFIVDSLKNGAPLSQSQNNDLFGEDGAAEAVKKLLESDFFDKYATPVLIDFSKAVSLFLSAETAKEDEKIHSALMMSRVNFMGTDGIRGKVVTDSNTDFITALLSDNAFTPELVTTTAFSFAQILKMNEIVVQGDTFVIGNDGRDKAYDWKLNNAVCEGFNRAGIKVLDLGVVPTAIIPWKMLQLNHRGGACLTASHNPSNQNGIKFFIDGAKLLPEGDLGDYTLSAFMYYYCRLESMPAPVPAVEHADVEQESVDFMLDVLPDSTAEALRDTVLVFDSANGATHTIGAKVLESLGATYTSRNEVPSGDNINRECGVAEIEGTELFRGDDYDSHIPFVKELFDRGRENDAGKVWGIPLDGDGDRGFLMYYDKKNDDVHVLDGDKCGYILSRYLIEKEDKNPAENWFISTIESDIMTANAAEKNLGLNKKVVAVGDKWIGNFTEGQVLVGLEISGHLIFPISVKDQQGAEKELLSGVGLLTGLVSLAAVKALDLSEEEIIEPFEPGFSETNYTYFVDKSMFYRGSAIWNEDISMLESLIGDAVTAGDLPKNAAVEYEDKEDPNVLYANITAGDDLAGVIFMRNSGTEEKNAVYVKGQQAYQAPLSAIGKKLQAMHIEKMKKRSSIEFICEEQIKSALDGSGTDVDSVLANLSKAGHSVSETDLFGVLHGLKKEGSISVDGRKILSK